MVRSAAMGGAAGQEFTRVNERAASGYPEITDADTGNSVGGRATTSIELCQPLATMKFAELTEIVRAQIDANAAEKLLSAICAAAAGEYVYIPRRHDDPKIEPNDTPATVARRYGVSRQTGYNWVNRWRK